MNHQHLNNNLTKEHFKRLIKNNNQHYHFTFMTQKNINMISHGSLKIKFTIYLNN